MGSAPTADAPSAGGRCTHDAYTGGVDMNLKTADGNWGALAQIVGSLRLGGPSRTLPDGTLLGPGSAGCGVFAEVGKYGGKNWLFHLEYLGTQPDARSRRRGLSAAVNVHHLHPFLTLRTTRPRGPMLEGWR